MNYGQILAKYNVDEYDKLGAALDEILNAPIKVPIVIEKGGVIPSKATKGSGGYDLHVPEDTIVKEGRFCVPLNIRFALPYGYVAIIKPRSGYTLKGLEVINTYGQKLRMEADAKDGVIDSDYTGIVGTLMKSDDMRTFTLKKGTRVAQMLIVKVADVEWEEVEELDETERADGGYGHTS